MAAIAPFSLMFAKLSKDHTVPLRERDCSPSGGDELGAAEEDAKVSAYPMTTSKTKQDQGLGKQRQGRRIVARSGIAWTSLCVERPCLKIQKGKEKNKTPC